MLLDKSERAKILSLLKQEITPAIGCTEPIAVALAVAKTRELLATIPEKIDVHLSSNVLKNAMGVGIPGTGMTGLPIAIAAGAIIGKSDYGLEVLKDINSKAVEQGKDLINKKIINIFLKENAPDKLYIEVISKNASDTAKVIIAHEHNRFVFIQNNEEILLSLEPKDITPYQSEQVELNFNKVCNFALESPIEELHFILQSVELNKAAANEAMKGIYGHNVAQTLASMGNNMYSKMLSVTAAACETRMAGAMIPVMSNSGSGNQGIAATLPVSVFAEESGKTDEQLIRGLILSHLMTIYIKQSLGRLSGLCGAVVATIGSSCAITYMMGGDRKQIGYSIKNMIGNITGMICDGAKPSCALKVSSGVSTATLSSMMAMGNKVLSSLEGITDEDVDKTIQNLTRIGRTGMVETDKMVLDIMTHKE